MARTRRRIRRRGLTILVAVVVSVVVVGVGHDVRTLSARSQSNRASLNLGFAALAQSILTSEQTFAVEASALLAQGPTESRTHLGTELQLLDVEGAELKARVALLATPAIDGDAQGHLITVVNERVAGVLELLANAAASVDLPHQPFSWPGVPAIQATFGASNTLWVNTAQALLRAPGGAVLTSSDFPMATAPLASELAALAAAPSLAPVRKARIAAIEVNPSPFPSRASEIILPPVTSVQIDAVARNDEYIDQPLALTVSFTPSTTGAPVTQTVHLALGPLDAHAVSFAPIVVAAGEHGVLTVTLSGPRGGSAVAETRTFTVIVAPAPTG